MTKPLRRPTLQVRLVLAMALVVVLATGTGYWFIHQSVQRAFSDFSTRDINRQDQILIGIIRAYYRETGSLEGLIDRLDEQDVELSVLILNPERVVVYSPERRLAGVQLSDAQMEGGISLVLPTGETWTVVPYRYTPGRDDLEDSFLQTTVRSLWLAGLGAGLVGLLISILLARQLMDPLRTLDEATRQIAHGDLSKRIDVVTTDEIGRLAGSFNEMAESLEASERVQKRMIADISHELRTPITAVRSALESLRDGHLEPSQEVFAGLHNRVMLFTRLVNDLGQLALADTGCLPLNRVAVHVADLVKDIEETIGAALEDAGLKLSVRMDPGLRPADSDPQRIEQVLLNLISNASRHARDAGTVSVEGRMLDETTIEISVCDDGPGLSEEDRSHVFERFYRVDRSRTGDDGSGLGLAIAKAIVEQHGGQIHAENGPGGGACFRLTLPATGGRQDRGSEDI